MAIKIYTHEWGFNVLYYSIYPHIQRTLLWFIQISKGNFMDARCSNFTTNDGYGIHGLCFAVGTDELLGCNGYN